MPNTMPKMLTKGAVEKLKPWPDCVREITDRGAAGLRLCIQPSGKKSWVMRFRRPSGAHAKLTLGPLDLTARETNAAPVIGQPLSLTEARALAAEVNRQRAAGIDVAARHVQEKKRRAAASDEPTTFEAVARRFAEEHALKNRSGRVNTARVLGLQYPKEKGGEPTVIKGGLADRWRDRSIAEVDAGDCYGAIAEAVRSGVPGLEDREEGSPRQPRPSRRRRAVEALQLGRRASPEGWQSLHRRVQAAEGRAAPPRAHRRRDQKSLGGLRPRRLPVRHRRQVVVVDRAAPRRGERAPVERAVRRPRRLELARGEDQEQASPHRAPARCRARRDRLGCRRSSAETCCSARRARPPCPVGRRRSA